MVRARLVPYLTCGMRPGLSCGNSLYEARAYIKSELMSALPYVWPGLLNGQGSNMARALIWTGLP